MNQPDPNAAPLESFRVAFVLMVALLGLNGCSWLHRTHVAFDGSARVERPSSTGPEFVYEKQPIHIDNDVLEELESERYRVRRLHFSSLGDNGQTDDLVTVDFHQSRRPGRWPAIIVLPIWGNTTYPPRTMTRHFKKASNGEVHVLNMLGESYLIDWPAIAQTADRETFMRVWEEGAERERVWLIDIRRLIDWAETRPEIDAARIGLIGFSHGAILAGTVATQEPRIAATVLVMGGAHANQVIAFCDGERTGGAQDFALASFGWTQSEFADRLEPVFRAVDPATYPGRADPSRILIIDSKKDRCMPESSRESLWQAMGLPERYTIHADHRTSFFSMTALSFNWMRHRIWDFLETRLGIGTPCPRHR